VCAVLGMSASAPVFISYAHGSTSAEVRALRDALRAAGTDCFLDERAIPDGGAFPEHLAQGLLGARVAVVFADAGYFSRPWCVYEFAAITAPMRHGESEAHDHVVVALPADGAADGVLAHLPPALARASWPRADETERLAALVGERLAVSMSTLADRLTPLDDDAVKALRRGGAVPTPSDLAGLRVPLRGLPRTLGDRFTGRDELLWQVFHVLETRRAGSAQVSCALRGPAGMGKSQLAAEYAWRYAAHAYSGGVVWIDASGGDAELARQFDDVLEAFAPGGPRGADGEGEVARVVEAAAARGGVLWIVDDLPEPRPGAPAPGLDRFCPARRGVSLLCTTRGAGASDADFTIDVEELAPGAAVELLTQPPVRRDWLSDDEWRSIAVWVGRLPMALRILHLSLVEGFASARDLVDRAGTAEAAVALDAVADDLREDLPAGSVRGVTEALGVAYDGLQANAALVRAAHRFALLGPSAIEELALAALVGQRALGRLGARGWIDAADGDTGRRWRMHRVLASFLRARDEERDDDLRRLAAWFAELPNSQLRDAGFHLGAFERRLREAPPSRQLFDDARALALTLATRGLGDPDMRSTRYLSARLVTALGVGDELVRRLREAAEDPDDAVAAGVPGVLSGQGGREDAAGLLVELLHDARVPVRRAAMVVAVTFTRGDLIALPVLDCVLSEDDRAVRESGVSGFATLVAPGSHVLGPVLRRLLESSTAPGARERATACTLLADLLSEHGEHLEGDGIDADAVAEALRDHLADEDEEVARAVAKGLGTLRDEQARAALTERLDAAGPEDRWRGVVLLSAYLDRASAPSAPRNASATIDDEGNVTFQLELPSRPDLDAESYRPLAEIVVNGPGAVGFDAAAAALTSARAGRQALQQAFSSLLEAGLVDAIVAVADALLAVADLPELNWWRGLALERLGRADDAIAAFGRTIDAEVSVWQARYQRASLLHARGDDAGALADLDAVLAVNADHAPALYDRAFLLYAAGHPADALTDLDRLVILAPDNPRGHHLRAGTLLALQRHAEAVTAAGRAIELDGSVAESWLFRGAAELGTGDTASAVADLEHASELDPNDARVQEHLAYARQR
jgi:tetratricopeptide (TPR) repeat protein